MNKTMIKKLNGKDVKVKKVGNSYIRMETKYRVMRFMCALAVIVSIIILGGIFKDNFVKVISPEKYLSKFEIETVTTKEDENKYFDNFLSTLEISNKVDLRDLRQYIMEINDMKDASEYHGTYSLKVPVMNKTKDNIQLVQN